MQQNVSWLKILTTISSIILLSLIERRVSQKILSGPELEETRSSEIQNPSVSWPMAVVLYDESQLTPFHKEYREFSFKEHRVKIKQNWRDIGVAAVVWDAAVALGQYLVNTPDTVRNKKVLELGSGTGLAGIVAAKIGADITLTDRESTLSILEDNISLNKIPECTKVKVEGLEWGSELKPGIQGSYDVIIGADVIYIEETFPLLLKTLRDLTDSNTQVILAQKLRYERDHRFLKQLEENFRVRKIEYQAETDVHIYSATKLKQT